MFLTLTAIVVIMTIPIGLVTTDNIVKYKQSMLSDSDFFFKQAILQDYNKRLKTDDEFYSISLTNDWPTKEITVVKEGKVKTQTNIDSIRRLSMDEKIRIINETALLDEHPINPDSLNACLQEILQQRNISLFTGIRYTEIDNNKTQYSGTDTAFFSSAYPLKEYKTGIFNEIAVQAYVKVPLTSLIEKAGARLLIPAFVWIVLISIYIIYMYKAIKKKQAEAKLTDADRIRELLQLNTEQSSLCYKDQIIELTPTFVQVISLFHKQT